MTSPNINFKNNKNNLSKKNNQANHQVETTKIKKLQNKRKLKLKNKNLLLKNKNIKLIEIEFYKHYNHQINKNIKIARTLKNI